MKRVKRSLSHTIITFSKHAKKSIGFGGHGAQEKNLDRYSGNETWLIPELKSVWFFIWKNCFYFVSKKSFAIVVKLHVIWMPKMLGYSLRNLELQCPNRNCVNWDLYILYRSQKFWHIKTYTKSKSEFVTWKTTFFFTSVRKVH